MRVHLLFPLFGSLALPAQAQVDAVDCMDPVFLARPAGFVIESCTEKYDVMEAQTEPGAASALFEGTLARLHYAFDDVDGGTGPAPADLMRHYADLIKMRNGRTLYSGSDDLYGGPVCGTFALTTGGTDFTVAIARIEASKKGLVTGYDLMVVSKETMPRNLTAAQMLETIRAKGFVALYIDFAPDTAVIDSGSLALVTRLATMLVMDSTMNVSIDAHTDNTGPPEQGKAVSDERAGAVMHALVLKGIKPGRLSTRGWGQEHPVADNGTEEGRARNRRIEIVEQ